MIQDTWKNFELSGKISDYLTYRQCVGTKDVENEENVRSGMTERGIGSYGTEHSSDGHGVKCNADWRV